MAVELASAYVTLIPSLKGAQGAIAKELGGVDVSGAGRDVGDRMGKGIAGSLKSFIGPAIALAGAVGVSKFVAESVTSLGRIEKINTQTETAIKSTGNSAGVTAKHIEDLAGRLEDMTATEAESIQQGANLLLTFKNIKNEAGEGNDVYDQTVVAMTDMARAMGTDAQGGAIQLGKALNDPIKGISALSRVGITFSDEQKNLITTMTESGDVMGAQKIILAELNSQFGGSAAAYAETYAGRMELLGHAVGTFGEAMSTVLMPALKALAIVGADSLNWAATLFGSDAYLAFGDRVGSAITGVVDLIKGDFTPAVREGFGLEEDAPLIGTFFALRDAAAATFGVLAGGFAGLGPVASAVFAEVAGGVQAMIGAFAAGGTDVTSSGFAGVLETIGLVARALWDTMSPIFASLGPQVLQLAAAFSPLGLVFKSIEPILPQVAASLVAVAEALGGTFAAVLPTVTTLMTTVAKVMTGVLAAVLPTIVTLVTTLADVAAQLVPPLADVATTIVGVLAGALGQILPQLATLAASLIGAIMPVLPTIATLFATLAKLLGATLGQALTAVLPILVDLVSNVLNALVPLLPVIASLVSSVATTLGGVLATAVQAILPILLELVGSVFAAFVPLLPVVGTLLEAVATVIGVLVQALVPLLPPLLTLVNTVFAALTPLLPTIAGLLALVAGVVVDLVLALAPLLPALTNLITIGLNVLLTTLTPLIDVIALVADILLNGLMAAITVIMPIIAGVISIVSTLAEILTAVVAVAFEALAAVITTVWDGIFLVIGTVWAALRDTIFAPLNLAAAAIGTAFSSAKSVIDTAWEGIKSAAKSAWAWVKDNVFAPFKDGIAAIGSAFDSASDVIGTAWDAIQSAAVAPVNFVIRKVYTEGIKELFDTIAEKLGLSLRLPSVPTIGEPSVSSSRPVNRGMFALGGVLPGWSPGRDIHEFFSPTGGRLSLSGGEAIMRPEFTKAVGGAAGVARLNSAARKGEAFADGGVWGWVKNAAGATWDFTKDAASAIGNFMKDPIAGALEVISKPVQAILQDIGGGDVGQIIAGIPRAFLGQLVDAASSVFGPARDSDGGEKVTAPSGPAMGYKAMIAAINQLLPGTAITSTYRPGAKVAGTNIPSMHGLGRAVDLAPSLKVFDTLAANFPGSAELLYSPAGGRQIQRGSGGSFRGDTSGVTKRMHYNHVHWAMNQGGVIPTLYDQGGYLPPGISVVENRTNKPEPVFTANQADKLGNGRTVIYHAAENKSLTAEQELLAALDRAAVLAEFGG